MMKWVLAGALVAALAAGACNDVGTCPAADSITPGGACSGESLECAYTLQTPSPACDATTIEGGIATSCVCTNGSWVCPVPVTCPPPPGDDGGGPQTGDDGGGGQESGADDGGGQEASGDGAMAE
jgi:hypothetical protein